VLPSLARLRQHIISNWGPERGR